MLHLWESLPFADCLAGPIWFRRFVVNPIPQHIRNIRGRYRGRLFKGFVIVTFDFDPPFQRDKWLSFWREIEVSSYLGPAINTLTRRQFNFTRTYIKSDSQMQVDSPYLLIDEQQNSGVVYEVSYYVLQRNQ